MENEVYIIDIEKFISLSNSVLWDLLQIQKDREEFFDLAKESKKDD